jgi:hypothetical protein
VVTFTPATTLTVDDPTGMGTVIDGYSQCNARANTGAVTGNAIIKIQIQGNLTDGVLGVALRSQNNVVRGLAVYNFDQQISIRGQRAHDNAIEGNFIGTNAAQTHRTDFPVVQSNGIDIQVNATENVIGGTTPDKRNLVSGNDQDGINIQGPEVARNVVIGNYVGLTQDGVTGLRNSSDGLDLAGGTHQNRIGGLNAGERNVFGGNHGDGIEISHDSTNSNQVLGNFVGLQADGAGLTGNGDRGVTFEDIVTDNVVRRNIIVGNGGDGVRFYTANENQLLENFIGVYPPGLTSPSAVVPNPSAVSLGSLVNAPNGTVPANAAGLSGVELLGGSQRNLIKNNVIANHPEYGVKVSPEQGYLAVGTCLTYFNTISENNIFNNGLHGIRLVPGACNSNRALIGNQGLPAPVINSATTREVSGTACANCIVEIFIADKTQNPNPGGDNNGEGRVFVGRGTANGSGAFTIRINGVISGHLLTATATSSNGNTSEFGRNTLATGPDIADNRILLPFIRR